HPDRGLQLLQRTAQHLPLRAGLDGHAPGRRVPPGRRGQQAAQQGRLVLRAHLTVLPLRDLLGGSGTAVEIRPGSHLRDGDVLHGARRRLTAELVHRSPVGAPRDHRHRLVAHGRLHLRDHARRAADRPRAALRGGPDRRRGCVAADVERDHPDDVPDDLLRQRDHLHRSISDLRPDPDHHSERRPRAVAPLDRDVPVPAGLPGVPGGLRLGRGAGGRRDHGTGDRLPVLDLPEVGAQPVRRQRIGRWILTAVLTVFGVFMLAPLVWLVSESLTKATSAFYLPPSWIPRDFTLENFASMAELIPFGKMFLNSVIVSVTATAGALLVSLMAAYAFSRLRFRFRDRLFALMLAALMVPMQMTIIPVFFLMRNLGLVDTLGSLILPALINVFA